MKIINLFINHTLCLFISFAQKKTEPVSYLNDKINLNQLMLRYKMYQMLKCNA